MGAAEHLEIVRLRVDVALLCCQGMALLALVAYVIYTARMAATMRAAYHTQTRPYVVPSVDVLPGQWSDVDFVLENVGHSPALNVTLGIGFADGAGPPARREWGLPRLLKQGVRYMAPGWQTRCPWMFGRDVRPMAFTVTVTYWDAQGGRRYTEDYPMDLTDLLPLQVRGRHPLHDIAASIQDLKDQLSRGGGVSHLPGMISQDVAVWVRSLPRAVEEAISARPSIWLHRPPSAPGPPGSAAAPRRPLR
jgi:hypothetical protein